MTEKLLNIGQAAAISGVSAKMIRAGSNLVRGFGFALRRLVGVSFRPDFVQPR
jgi:hypothetical protein